MCFMCDASSVIELLLFTTVAMDAGWRATRKTHESYVLDMERLGKELPVLFLVCIGLRLECCMIDILHCIDLGFTAHVVGNVFMELIRNHKLGPNQDSSIAALNKLLDRWYSASRTPHRIQGRLTVDRIRTSGQWPKLKSKAAPLRYLARFAAKLAKDFHDGTEHDDFKLALCTLLCRFYTIVESSSMFLSDAIKRELPEIGFKLGTFYAHLSAEAMEMGIKLWKFSPKVHLTMHLLEWQAPEFGNPRFWWCYADEDLVGLLIEVAEACHPRSMHFMALYKWLILFYETMID